MFLELIATFTVGVGAAGVVMMARMATRGRLARWAIPAGAGLAMIGFTIWSEYSWYARTSASLPEGVEIAWANTESAPWRPWTYLMPITTRFIAIDTATMRTHDRLPGQRLTDLYLMGRWAPNRRVRAVFDCASDRRADLLEGAEIGPDGAVEGADWIAMAPDDPVLVTACERGTS